jgi:uncharacterized protein YneF (UPF0154 family)
MDLKYIALLTALGLIVGIAIAIEVGRRIGQRTMTKDPEGAFRGTGGVEGAVYGLFGLLLAFTFSGAAARFEARRHLVTEEANAIGTAYLRIDVLPPDARPAMRALFKDYTSIRSTIYQQVNTNWELAKAENERSIQLQQQIWDLATTSVQRTDAFGAAPMLVLPSLNAMIDITTTRNTELSNHPPFILYILFLALSIIVSLLIGYNQAPDKRRKWLHSFVFATVTACTFYVIIDLEFPRLGLIRVDHFDAVLINLSESMK